MNIPITATPAEVLGFRLATMSQAEIHRELADRSALLAQILDVQNTANLLLREPRPYPPVTRRDHRIAAVRLRKMETELNEEAVRHA